MSKSAGFTLMELMMALAIVVLLSAAIVSAFAVGLKAWDKVQQQADYHQTAAAILETIGADLRGAWLGNTQEGFFKLAAGGGNASLSFTTLAPVKETGGLTQFVEIAYRREGDRLLRAQQSLSASPEESPEEDVIAEGVEAFSLRAGKADTWQEQWQALSRTEITDYDAAMTSPPTLPDQVEITVAISDPATGKPAQLKTVVPLAMGHP